MKAVSDIVLDASAILALIQNEPGAEKVAAVFPRAIVSAANLAEVITKLVQKVNDPAAVVKNLALLELRVRSWDEEAAQQSAQYVWLADLGLSLGDRPCITTAAISGLPILTADRRWKSIKAIAARIDLIR